MADGSTMEFNLADLWEAVVDAVPAEREALVCGDRRLTYGETDARANRLAHALAARGVGPGDHVAVDLHNSTEYLETMLAAFKLRAVPINVNYRYVSEELRYLLDDSDAAALVLDATLLPVLARVRDRLPALHSVVAVGDEHLVREASTPAAPLLAYEELLSSARPERDFGPRAADDLYVLYTGGTTGMPKGVLWRHVDVFFGAFGGGGGGGDPIRRPEEIAQRCLEGRTRCLPACPFMHGTAHWMAFTTLYGGGRVVISPDRHLDPPALWRLVEREGVTMLVIVGDAFARPLLDALDEVGTASAASLRVVLSGGAVLSPGVKRELAERLPGAVVVDGYGASETGGQGQAVTVAGAEVPSTARFRVGAETTVLSPGSYRPAAVGEVGLLARRGHIPLGYYRDRTRTETTFPVVDGVRWAVPGDHAVREPDGTITVLGRGSVSINTGGEKVYPEEIEAALKCHADVADAVVVGVPDPRWGERVVAVVQPRPGRVLDLATLEPTLRPRLARYKMPRSVVLVREIVRTASGKTDYRWARQAAGAAGDAPGTARAPAGRSDR